MNGANDAWDVAVVGGGPSGAAAALALARRGASVLLVERSALPRWKVCGACLGPAALWSLSSLGVGEIPERTGAVPLERMLLRHRGRVARLRLSGWVALSRTRLDEALVRGAEGAGVTVWTEAAARLGRPGGSACRLQIVRQDRESEVVARVVIDATGLGRGLSEDRRPTTRASRQARIGVGAELEAPDYPVDVGELHMAVGREGYVGLVRVEGGRLNVAAALDAAAMRGTDPADVVARVLAQAGLPPLPAPTLRGWRGTPALDRSGDVGGERLLRVGDAAGYVEPFTGEGIGWALADGLTAATCAERALDGAPGAAVAAWRRHRVERRASAERLCRLLARGLRHPRIVGLSVTALRALPAAASPLVRSAARAPSSLVLAAP